MQTDHPAETPRPAVLVFRKRLIPYSETFIVRQAAALRHHRPVFAGFRRDESGAHLLDGHRPLIHAELSPLAPLSRAVMRMGGPPSRRWLEAIRRERPRLLHAYFGGDAAAAWPVARALEIPMVVTFLGWDITTDNESARVLAARRVAFERSSRIVGCSEFIRRKLIEKGAPEEKVVAHYVGVDPEDFRPDPEVERRPRILCVGRLDEKKGHEYLFRAFALIQDGHPDVELLVVGDGPLRESLHRLAADLELRCRFVGARPPEEVRRAMNEARVGCLPSVVARTGNAEGLPTVLLEYLSMGLPTAGFDSNGVGEALDDGVTGLLAPERDVEALAANLDRLLRDGALRERLAQAGRALVSERFNLHDQAASLEEIYDEVLA